MKSEEFLIKQVIIFLWGGKEAGTYQLVPVSSQPQQLLLWHVFECLLQQFPEGSHGLDEGALGSGVWRLHRGTEGYNVQMWILTQYDRALQTGVVHLNDAVLAEEFLIFF